MASSNGEASSIGKDPETQRPESSQNSTSPSIKIPSVPNLPKVGDSSSSVNIPSFSKLLEGVMAAGSRQLQPVVVQTNPDHPLVQNFIFEVHQGKYEMSHREALESVTAKAAQSKVEAQTWPLPEPPTPALPTNTDKQLVLYQERAKASPNNLDKQLILHQDEDANAGMPNHFTEPLYYNFLKSTSSDGYKWRKYGQKQVKSSESYRSYYRCTFVGCSAKKTVLQSDGSQLAVDVDYKGEHNHDPPQQIRGKNINKKRRASFAGVLTDNVKDAADSVPERLSAVSDLPKCSKEEHEPTFQTRGSVLKITDGLGGDGNGEEAENENVQKPNVTQGLETNKEVLFPEENRSRSDDCSGSPVTDTNIKEHEGTSKQTKRVTDGHKALSPDSKRKALKHPKIVVHAATDVGMSGDGYRWRKYGQKAVKGNPHPRSYYRCTSAGCPVRKQVERATDSSAAIVVTYEGEHDHDVPVPKKPKISASNNNNAAATNDVPLQKSGTLSPSSSDQGQQWPSTLHLSGDVSNGDMKVVKMVDSSPSDQFGPSDKMLESATTLLSMGAELKSC
uniref:WRKY transcription factor 10 n=1 Tax=Tamarix hispida TaxID=189793 RepID=J9ZY82_9CARY|nr:WRKY transcription factor 10 [Tamarix hispida]